MRIIIAILLSCSLAWGQDSTFIYQGDTVDFYAGTNTVYLFHGGGFTGGSRHQMDSAAGLFKAAGYGVYNMDYPLVSGVPPCGPWLNVQDSAAARVAAFIQQTRQGRVYLAGYSAGAGLAGSVVWNMGASVDGLGLMPIMHRDTVIYSGCVAIAADSSDPIDSAWYCVPWRGFGTVHGDLMAAGANVLLSGFNSGKHLPLSNAGFVSMCLVQWQQCAGPMHHRQSEEIPVDPKSIWTLYSLRHKKVYEGSLEDFSAPEGVYIARQGRKAIKVYHIN